MHKKTTENSESCDKFFRSKQPNSVANKEPKKISVRYFEVYVSTILIVVAVLVLKLFFMNTDR